MQTHHPPTGPLQFSEVILRTSRYEEMKAWYLRLLGMDAPSFETVTEGRLLSVPEVTRLCFLRIHFQYPLSQTLGIFEVRALHAPQRQQPGLDHVQLRETSLENLARRYEALQAGNLLPTRCYNHGPGTSFYYTDPDGNEIEMSAANFDTEAEYLAFFGTEEYRNNVEGHPVDPQVRIRQIRGHAPLAGR